MARMMNFAKTVGCRLDQADLDKLRRLCAYTDRPPSALLRLLIRCAEPRDLRPFEFVPPSTPERSRG